MPQFAPRRALIEAYQFDGSVESAMACAKGMGKALRIIVDESGPGLMMGRTKIAPGTWIIPGSKPRLVAQAAFDATYVALDALQKPAAAVALPPALASRPSAFDIEEGDTVIDLDDQGRVEYEALEFDPVKRTWFCDSVWGARDINESRLEIVRKAGES